MINLEPEKLQGIYAYFGLNPMDWHCVSFGTGLINSTWVLKSADGSIKYILQKINSQVFHHPEDIAHNLDVIGEHLSGLHPEYLFVHPYKAPGGESYYRTPDGEYYRIFPFVKGSKTLDVVSKAEQAYEAARSFGRFSYLLSDVAPSRLKETLPHFHDLDMRHRQFAEALAASAGSTERKEAAAEIDYLQEHAEYVRTWWNLKETPGFRLRIMHHDTKISNILFDQNDKALCVIDLDTVMPGYFISDVGDMMRTYLCPVSEEEKDFSKIRVRPEYFRAIVSGYVSGMEGSLTPVEQDQFLFAGRFMIYMQAIRFLADYLIGDKYYGARYPGHNLVRARNQIALLKAFNKAEEAFRHELAQVLPPRGVNA